MYTDEKHKQVKLILRIVGIILICIGIAGIVLFSLNTAGILTKLPELNILFFLLGFPPLFGGIILIVITFISKIAKFQAKEAVEVNRQFIKDSTSDYQGLSKDIANSVKETNTKTCSKCNHVNDSDAKFCDECGTSFEKVCPTCNAINDVDAKYCKSCGKEIK